MSSLSPDAALRAANRRGIMAMSASMALFVANDALVKFVSQSLPGPQLIFVRGLFASALLIAVAHAMGTLGQVRVLMQRPVLIRATLDAVASMVYLTALFHLPIGNATAINLATPLFITLFAAMMLRERVGLTRWTAIMAGFTGVVMVVQPKADGFNAYALLALLGTLFHAMRDISTRYIASSTPSILITVSTGVAVTLLSGVITLFTGWQPLHLQQALLLAVASVFLGSGYYLLIQAMREGEMSLIAPFRYSGLLFAVAIGYVVWGDVPNLLAWAGIALLVGAGLYMLHTERLRKQAALDAASD